MPLSMATPGCLMRILRISGRDEQKKLLGNMGFVPDETVTLVSQFGGNVIVNIKESRVAISEKMARRIFVEEA